ncbi:MAG: relaxase/mobilization nuclease domain-containing protein [Rhodococcus sp. (in: high G+C Gram-positive bacteria)]|uniref:relaxase/mobilization nuclease domain-containing protein n=1 Tax=Rhodococcus sp. TaxID=1831 RepID=UPI003BB13641
MIAKIVRGEKMTGLLSYLQGPGRANEHTDPHLVAGDSAIMTWHDDNELSHEDAIEIARQLDQPRRVFGTEVKVPNYMRDANGVDVRDSHGKKLRDPIDPFRDANVWHCSLSLHADEGQLADDEWGEIAREFMDEMGFTESSGRSPARWVAVRHGLSSNGNDHIHIAASAVREDGTKVDLYRDWKRASEAVNTLERKHGLAVVESRNANTGERGYHRAEKHRAAREGSSELDRELLARRVRACATASKTEAEFVRRLRGQGLIVRPRMASGRTDVVVGYKVAVRPSKDGGATPVFYGGGHLAKDLSLPRLRKEWEDSPTTSTEAVAEWNIARRDMPFTKKGREAAPINPALVARAARDIESWNKYLTSIPVTDRAQWARAAGRTAGVFAAWSTQLETKPGPLAKASVQLARSAQIPAHQHWSKKAGALSAGGAALIMLQMKPGIDTSAAYALLLRQLMKTTEAIAAAHRASGEAARAAELELLSRTQLESVHRQLATSKPTAPAHGSVTLAEHTQQSVATESADVDPSLETAYEARRLAELDAPRDTRDAVRRPPLPPKLEPRQRTSARDGLDRNSGNER